MTTRLERRQVGQQRRLRKGRLALLIAALLIFLLAVAASYYWFSGGLKRLPGLGLTGNKVHIIVLGVDERAGDVGRSDTLFLLSVDTDTKEVSMLSIPRDTRVKIPGHGFDKINHAYALGGAKLTRQAVENLLGVPIDYQIKINFAGFYKVVDAVGGVDITVDKRMYYSDPWDDNGGLVIDLRPGLQHLDGKAAIKYVRYRDEEGDIGRIERQQNFIKAMLRQVASPAIITRIPAIIREVGAVLETDMSTNDMLKLAKLVNDANKQGIKTDMVPGKPAFIREISYWLPDIIALRQHLAQIEESNFAGKQLAEAKTLAAEYERSIPAEMKVIELPKTAQTTKEKADSAAKPGDKADAAKTAKPPVPGKLTASIINASGNAGAAAKMTTVLRNQGFDVVGTTNGTTVMANTVVVANTTDSSVVNRLTGLPFNYVLRVTKDDGRDTDFTVVIGKDYN